MEVFTLTIELIFGIGGADEGWKRVIEIPENASLSDLHFFIQKII